MAYFRCGGGGIPSSIKTDMNAVLNKKFGTQGETYPPTEWADDVNLMGVLPVRTATGTIAHFEDGADDVPMKSVVANIVPIQSGTGTPSPSNPRPISGTSVLNVEQRGKNLFDPTTEFSTLYVYAVAKNVLPSETCTMSFTDNDTTQDISGVYFGFVSSNYTGGAPTVYRWGITNGTVTNNITNVVSGENMTGLFFYPNNPTTLEKVLNRFNVQIEVGLTATTYEPYNAETYTIDLGQTIYGGSAEVVGGRGTSDLKYLEIDGTEASLTLDSASNVVRLTLSDLPSSNVSSQDYRYWGSESIYKYAATANLGNNEVTMRTSGYLYYKNTSCTTLSDFQMFFATQKANKTPFAVCYELATPTDFTFEGEEINSYLGVNNVWTDSGEVAVEYRADIDLLIAELEGNRGLQMMRATPTEENNEQEATENEDER